MENNGNWISLFRKRIFALLKAPQTLLLLLTGLAGYMTARCPILNFNLLLGAAGSLFLSISGSTVLNMWYDRDIDAQMARTCERPLASHQMLPEAGLLFGLIISVLGIGWALYLDPLFGLLVFGGLFFDVVIYTIWLKRRTPWAILWGGISGGMPVLAGRALGVGQVDWIGICLALAILFWIPTHILTISIRYHEEYISAGIPTFPSEYGFIRTRQVIAFSSVLAALAMGLSAFGVGLSPGLLGILAFISLILFTFAVKSLARPSEKATFNLFKFASLYMMAAMLLLIIGVT
jgi:heme o synthase